MGVSCSCPLPVYCDLENGIESIIKESLNHKDDEQKTPFSSTSSDYEPKMLKSPSSEELLDEKSRYTTTMRCSNRIQSEEKRINQEKAIFDSNSLQHEAAIKLQKVYKSFRTRRKLADCAVLIEQSWWKVLDFAELKHSSVSFFDLEKHETAISRWSRARTRAAKVGKGLSKNGKARKLALQHWLEAIDPRHRYGHNLHFYYVKWLNSQSKEPFFYWLDIGEGKEVNLIEKCPRSKLQQQCIKYLGPMERQAYEVSFEDGILFNKQTGEFLDTPIEPKGCKWIFVLSTSRILYVGKKKKGSFQHSSFLAGGVTLAAGRIVVEKGILKAVWPHSGHYRPTPENFQDFISFLEENNVDLTDVKLDCIDDEEGSIGKKVSSVHLLNNSSEDELAEKDRLETPENEIKSFVSDNAISRKPNTLQIPSKHELFERLKSENQMEEESNTIEMDEDIIPEESILRRINSHKETNSYQLGKQLSFKWSTGSGPRIGCLRDYPTELQSHALEQVNLSPKSQRRLRFEYPCRALTPTSSNLSRKRT